MQQQQQQVQKQAQYQRLPKPVLSEQQKNALMQQMKLQYQIDKEQRKANQDTNINALLSDWRQWKESHKTAESIQLLSKARLQFQTEKAERRHRPMTFKTEKQPLNREKEAEVESLKQQYRKDKERRKTSSALTATLEAYRKQQKAAPAVQSWYERVYSAVSRVPALTKVTGVVTSLAKNAVKVTCSGAIKTFLVPAAIALGTGGTSIALQLGVVAATTLTFEIIAMRKQLWTDPWTGTKTLVRRLIGKTLTETPAIVIGTIFPGLGGALVGGTFTGLINNLSTRGPYNIQEKMVPTNETVGEVVKTEQLWNQSLGLQQATASSTKAQEAQVLAALNAQKPTLLKSLAAKAVSVAYTSGKIAALVASGFIFGWDNAYVAPVIQSALVSTLFSITSAGQLTQKVANAVETLMQRVAPRLANAHVAPEAVRTFFKQRLEWTLFEDLTWANLVAETAKSGLEVGTGMVFAQTVSVARKWESLADARHDIQSFYNSALDYANSAMEGLSAGLQGLNGVFQGAMQAGIRALTPGYINKALEQQAAQKALEKAIGEASAIQQKEQAEQARKEAEVTERAAKEAKEAADTAHKAAEAEKQKLSDELGVTFGTPEEYVKFVEAMKQFEKEHPELYRRARSGPIEFDSLSAIAFKSTVGAVIPGVGPLLAALNTSRTILNTAAGVAQLGSWFVSSPWSAKVLQATAAVAHSGANDVLGALPDKINIPEGPQFKFTVKTLMNLTGYYGKPSDVALELLHGTGHSGAARDLYGIFGTVGGYFW